MDKFFNGLDGRLRVSGMVADSIMMGIVNSAMEDAYKKSCTKEGDLERLNEKSRFCELAIMQLEWCLKYLQEETNKNFFDDNCDRDGLLYDLLETRDRIHHRLEETELAIAEKDRELLERKEAEVDLRLALEMKDVDIYSLQAALGIEREKIERAAKSFHHKSNITEKKAVYAIKDVKDGVGEQTQKLKRKLEEGKKNLMAMLKGQDSSWLSLERESMAQMILELDEMVVDVNVLKEKFDMSFRMMVNSISSFKMLMSEKHWIWNFEKETINIITRNFVKDTQDMLEKDLGTPREDVSSDFLNPKWSTVIACIRKLHNGIEGKNVSPQINGTHVHVRADSHRISSMLRKACSALELSKQSSFVHSISKGGISNHEHVILKKTREINRMVSELTEGKNFLAYKNDRSHYYVEEILSGVILMLDFLIEEKITFSAICDDDPSYHEDDQLFYHDSISRFQQHERSTGKPCCKLAQSNLHEGRSQLEQEKFDLGFHLMILNDMYIIFFKSLIEMIHLDESIKAQIKEDLFKIFLTRMVVTWGYHKDGSYAKCVLQKLDDDHHYQMHFALPSFAEFSRQLEEFELSVHDKMCLNLQRLEKLECDINPLVDKLRSIKSNGLLYEKAFTRRCFDLQTAEEEVDLLGDQVDKLFSLIEVVYGVLFCHSPTLQHISEVMDVLRLIENELREGRLLH